MSIFSSIATVVGKVAVTAYGILKSALPVLQALRPAVEEVDQVFDFIEDKIAEGGEIADDFLDRNIEAIVGLEQAANRGVAVMQKMAELAAELRISSQERTPDTITEDEAVAIGEKLLEVKALLSSWGPELDAAIAKMEGGIAAEETPI